MDLDISIGLSNFQKAILSKLEKPFAIEFLDKNEDDSYQNIVIRLVEKLQKIANIDLYLMDLA